MAVFRLGISASKKWLVGRLVIGVYHIAHALPSPIAPRLGAVIGLLLYIASARCRKIAFSNLRYVYGKQKTKAEIRKTVLETFRNLGRSAIEFLRLPLMTDEDVQKATHYEGREYLDAALAKGKGCIIISAHLGCWEMIPTRLALDGYAVNVIAREIEDSGVRKLHHRIRGKRGYATFSRNQGLRPMVKALHRNELLGIFLDQNYTTGIFVPFFGRLAATATGAALMARMTGAVLLPCYCFREPDGTHCLHFTPPVDFTPTNDKEEDTYRITSLLTQSIEDIILEHPTQWMWLHNRWKHRPADEAASEPAFLR